MKVYVFPGDMTGCGHYRLIWPALTLIDQGHDIELVLPHQRGSKLVAQFDVKTGECINVTLPSDAAVVVFQRPTHVNLSKAITRIREQGIAVVIDMDDDLSNVHPSNPAFAAMHPDGVKRGISEHSWVAAQDACMNATVVQVSTPALLRRYAPHGRGQVLRNCVPKDYLSIEHFDNDVIGYAGAWHSHANDVPILGTSVARLVREGERFMSVGQAGDIVRALNIPDGGLIEAGAAELEHWPRALSSIGIGVAPLADTMFNRAKSWLKPLEMAAVGVPCVISPCPEYTLLHELGVGLVAERPKDWYRLLRSLVKDASRRTDLAQGGREAVAGLTYENHAKLWWDTWVQARELEDAGTP